jgi:hypothetical protein
MVTSRLVWILERWGLLLSYQCGFWCKHSSVDHLVTMEEQARQAFLTKKNLVGFSLTLRSLTQLGKWDSVNPWLLEVKGPAANLFISFQQLRVWLGMILLPPHIQENGIPRGRSVLSVTLFDTAVNGTLIQGYIAPLCWWLHHLLQVPISSSHWMTTAANHQAVVSVESGKWF